MLSRSLRHLKHSSVSLPLKYTTNRSLLNKALFTTSSSYSNDIPWYLKPEESPTVTSPLKKIEIPDFPENHPQTLENIVIYLAQELGIDNLIIFDMRTNKNNDNDNNNDQINQGAYDISDFMVIGTGKSSKHLQKASSQLDFYVKHNLHKLPSTEGILKSGELAKYHRRLQKKGKKAPNYSKHNYGAEPNTWVMTDTKSDGIIIHMLTKERRNDLNLEYLWSNEKEKVKYKNISSSRESDDIFKGIRYFHTSSRILNNNSNFDVYDLSLQNYTNHFNSLLKSHLVDYKTTTLEDLQNHLDLMYSSSLSINSDLLYSYFNTILQSEEFHKLVNTDSQAFKSRQKFFSNTINRYNIHLNSEEILKFLPLLIISGSQFDHPFFITLKKIIENPKISKQETVRYSKIINQFSNFSNKILDSLDISQREMKRKIDLLLLSVFANRSNWIHFNQVIKAAIIRNDISILKAALPLVTICADLKTSAEFQERVLPLLIESGVDPELEIFIEMLSQKLHNH